MIPWKVGGTSHQSIEETPQPRLNNHHRAPGFPICCMNRPLGLTAPGSLLLEDTWLGYQTGRGIRAAHQHGSGCGWNVTHETGTARLSVFTAVSRSTTASAHQARTTATNQTTASMSPSIRSMLYCLRTYSPPTGDAIEQEGTEQASIT